MLEPPSKESLRQRKKQILDKYVDGGEISDEDFHELIRIRMWKLRPRDMEGLYAKLREAVKEIYDEIVQRSIEIEKREKELIQFVRDKFRLD
jgi:polyhydroxyalkanoate synthesis regulator phasin